MGSEFFYEGHKDTCPRYHSNMGMHVLHQDSLQRLGDPTYSRPYQTPPQFSMTKDEWERRRSSGFCTDECCGFRTYDSYCVTCGVMFGDGHGNFCPLKNKDHVGHNVISGRDFPA
ncbi:MAG: hypothetical protein HZC02_03005 [Candidatus Levybacteria bacterium]|nr:hypothetical protein [Candidatus Levybacteria bacterium]